MLSNVIWCNILLFCQSGTSRGHIASEADVSSLSVHQGHLVATCYDGIVRVFCLKVSALFILSSHPWTEDNPSFEYQWPWCVWREVLYCLNYVRFTVFLTQGQRTFLRCCSLAPHPHIYLKWLVNWNDMHRKLVQYKESICLFYLIFYIVS